MYEKIIYVLNSDPFVDDPDLLNAKEQGIYNGNIKAGEAYTPTIVSNAMSITDANYVQAVNDIIALNLTADINTGSAVTLNVNAGGALTIVDKALNSFSHLPKGIILVMKLAAAYQIVGILSDQNLRSTDDVEFNTVKGVPYLQETGINRILYPKGAAKSSLGTTGAIEITIPEVPSVDTMITFQLNVYDHSGNKSFVVYIGGYVRPIGNTWYAATAYILADSGSDRNFTVRFGDDGTNRKIWIGELTSSWGGLQASIFNLQVGYSSVDIDNWDDGWIISMESTAFNSVDSTISNTQVGRIKDGQEVRGIKHDIGNSLPTTGWVAHTGDYAYKYNFADSNITANDIVMVAIDVDSLDVASEAEIASAVDSYVGGVTFYCNTVPTSAITFDYVVMKG